MYRNIREPLAIDVHAANNAENGSKDASDDGGGGGPSRKIATAAKKASVGPVKSHFRLFSFLVMVILGLNSMDVQ
jgi:hypothetical protein